MGYSLTWLLIRGKLSSDVLQVLGLEGTGQREEYPESKINGATLPNGWFVVLKDHQEIVASDKILAVLTSACEAVTCFVEEHVMYSAASGWHDGKKSWYVIHNSRKQKGHLETQGTLPEIFESIREEFESKQKLHDPKISRVDFIFEIPVELAARLTGFRHDRQMSGLGKEAFEVLKEIPLPVGDNSGSRPREHKPWWKLW